MPEPKPFVFILGMHRSGTSCLAGCLERCGLRLGAVRRSGRFNAKGYYELKALERLHDQILALNGGTWYQPPKQVVVHPYHQQALREIADQLAAYRPSGVKEPRLLLLLESWFPLIAPPIRLVGTFRHPLAVAQSLTRRNGITKEAGINLWLHYNQALIQRHQAAPFPLVPFDLSDVDSYCRNVAALALELGLSPKLSHLRHFVSRELDHHPTVGLFLPLACREPYAYLQDHCLRPVKGHPSTSGSQQNASSLWLDKGSWQWLGAVQEALFLATHAGLPRFQKRAQQLLRRGGT
jgi:hypothetical protein